MFRRLKIKREIKELHEKLISKEDKTEFEKHLLEDLGKADVYGPWSRLDEHEIGEIPRYQSFYLITDNKKAPNIDILK